MNSRWITFTQNNVEYMIKTVLNDDIFTMYLTDYRKIWAEHLPDQQLHQRFRDLNESFEFDLKECKKQILTLTENIGKATTISIEQKEDEIVLVSLNNTFLNFFVNFQFKLAICDQEMFFTEVTLPLLKTVKLLENQQRNLCELLLKKDREINEYMLEKGDTISKKYLITEPFEETKLLNKSNDNLMLGIFGDSSFLDSTKELDDEMEQSTKKMKKCEMVKERVKVYSSRTKKNVKGDIKYNGRNEK